MDEGKHDMSILIKGVEMPKGLGKTITIYPNGKVRVWVNNKGSGELLEQGAVPVPDHGRLIDADALYKKFVRLESEAMAALQTTCTWSVDGIKWTARLTERTGYKFDLADAPTIIPADPAEEGE